MGLAGLSAVGFAAFSGAVFVAGLRRPRSALEVDSASFSAALVFFAGLALERGLSATALGAGTGAGCSAEAAGEEVSVSAPFRQASMQLPHITHRLRSISWVRLLIHWLLQLRSHKPQLLQRRWLMAGRYTACLLRKPSRVPTGHTVLHHKRPKRHASTAISAHTATETTRADTLLSHTSTS